MLTYILIEIAEPFKRGSNLLLCHYDIRIDKVISMIEYLNIAVLIDV